jgi:Tfp pilus assembly protein PilF
MTFRHDLGTALAALVLGLSLALTGCAREPDPPDREAPVDPALAAVLREADVAMAAGRLAEAGRVLDTGLARAPDSPALWVAITRLRLKGGEHLSALEAAERALALGPDHPPALLLRAVMVRDAHGARAALPWFRSALAAAPHDPDIRAEYAATLGDGGEPRAMLASVRALAKIAPADPRVPFFQAVLAARAGDHALARSLLARSRLAQGAGPAAALQLDAVTNLAQGQAGSAVGTLEVLAARQPGNARVRTLLARALFDAGRAEEVIARFAAGAERPDASRYLVMVVARAYERIGLRARAAPLLARAYAPAAPSVALLAPAPGLPEPTNALRRAAGRDGALRAATQDIARLRRRFPTSADVAVLTGDAELAAGNARAALAAYAEAARVRRGWALTRKLVHTYRRIGDDAAADVLLARHVAGEPDHAEALVTLAERQAARGQWKRAALLLDHASACGAGHDPALLSLRLRAARALGRPDEARRFAILLAELRPRRLDKR